MLRRLEKYGGSDCEDVDALKVFDVVTAGFEVAAGYLEAQASGNFGYGGHA